MPEQSPANPFQPPTNSTAAGSRRGRQATAPIALSIGLGLVGTLFLLLLDGQDFRNRLIFTLCVLISGIEWSRFLAAAPTPQTRRFALYSVVIHIALLIALSLTLPQQYRQQKRFNDAVKELQEHRRSQVNRAASCHRTASARVSGVRFWFRQGDSHDSLVA